jgi:C4-dicarboxylate-specific signal transduction histidine kinase
MNMIDSKQIKAMAEYEIDRAKAKLDNAIDSEESRDEMIAARTQELIVKRMAEMSPTDIVCGLQSITEAAASVMRAHVLAGDMAVVGVMARALIHMFIEQDSEVIAMEWMAKIDRELASWEH